MPNGFTGSADAWNRAETALSIIDTLVPECIQDRKVTIVRNYHSWPSRSIEWVTGDLRRKVQVYLADQGEENYNVWLCASKEQTGPVLWRQEFLRQAVPWRVLSQEVRGVLIQGIETVESWTAADLTPARTA